MKMENGTSSFACFMDFIFSGFENACTNMSKQQLYAPARMIHSMNAQLPAIKLDPPTIAILVINSLNIKTDVMHIYDTWGICVLCMATDLVYSKRFLGMAM